MTREEALTIKPGDRLYLENDIVVVAIKIKDNLLNYAIKEEFNYEYYDIDISQVFLINRFEREKIVHERAIIKMKEQSEREEKERSERRDKEYKEKREKDNEEYYEKRKREDQKRQDDMIAFYRRNFF
jgi:adenylate kinase family enzyme